MRLRTPFLLFTALLLLASCATASGMGNGAAVLLEEDFEGENDNRYALNFTDFARWEVVRGSVDLVGKPPFDDFLPREQGMYVDLDGTTKQAGTLRSRERFALRPGEYRLSISLSGSPRPNQPPNTVIVTVGDAYRETFTLSSYAPLQRYTRTFRVRSATHAHLALEHLGGDDYGIFVDDIRLERR